MGQSLPSARRPYAIPFIEGRPKAALGSAFGSRLSTRLERDEHLSNIDEKTFEILENTLNPFEDENLRNIIR